MSSGPSLSNMVVDQIDRLLSARTDRTTRAAAESGCWESSLWEACEEMGLPLLLVPEAEGGVGLDWTGARAVFALLGRHAVPLPLGETILAARLLADAGIPVPAGPMAFAAAGDLSHVPWGRSAGHVVLVREGAIDLCRCRDGAVTPGANIGGDPRDSIDAAALDTIETAGLPGAGVDLVLEMGATLRAAQIAGALAASSALAIDYANVRVQFGRPLGKLQAVQQALAILACEAAAAEVASGMPARALDQGRRATFETAVAKIRAGEAAGTGAAIAHQVHGAIGFTQEHVLHDFTRRLWSWRSEYGSERFWASRLGRTAAKAGENLFAIIVNPSEAENV